MIKQKSIKSKIQKNKKKPSVKKILSVAVLSSSTNAIAVDMTPQKAKPSN
ncbi:hypothetical protein Q2295_09255 [Leptospira interrogans]|uniref:Uncharacterized protein n=1 Tax=Leptospira interrogans serovar Pomona TaxID=44276 RepID=A0AA41BHD5_LEPIR|nr:MULTISPECIES: hypothetical protein [Leptospira]EJO76736.1 hypothetical protein LEP1GSC045_2738 [Leptospira interrogans serovar Pomona str. Kennewicki LC82-25]EKN96232.1 hypothetical protein LEP1GSC014_3238 [Leptospira interrogans serovar Pomona str. Pomona]EMF31875.1 hypothetical protein LEP1GSC201_0930 [Leptospira interrogans serovar Pomona str. Fox 32256]EMI63139.1 hypothetical protein LEP1GSC200_3875 [Leptospira interrogans serovar Pomona str. CSL10083]EMJ64421.1 hypothetical protein LEP